MRIRQKLTLAFVAVALLPIAALTTVARVVVADRYRAELRRSLEAAQAEVNKEYERLDKEVVDATRRLAAADDRLVAPLLVALAAGPLEATESQALKTRVEAAMGALGLDILELVDEDGEVVAAGHFGGKVGDSDADALATARRAPGRARLVFDQVLAGGRAQKVLALEASLLIERRFGDRAVRVALVAGRVLGDDFTRRLGPYARLVAADGAVIAGNAKEPPHGPRARVPLDADDVTIAAVELTVPDDELDAALALIGWGSAALAAGGLALAFIAGALLARRVSEPLSELAEGARRVARGSLDIAVPVRTRDEVGELAATFNAMTRDLGRAQEELVRAERVAAWREIAQRIAHEIKNPLTPIQMSIETLQRAQQRGAPIFEALFAESAGTILDEVARLRRIVAEFSSFARMPEPRLAPVDLGEVVDGALALYKGGETPLELSLPRGLFVEADKEQLTQVVINLVENARDAVAQKGAVRVRARAAGGDVELEVADEGPGLSDEARAKLFTPYFTTKARGTGLGLAIVHRIVRDHGGEIRVENRGGAVFTVVLPAKGGPRRG